MTDVDILLRLARILGEHAKVHERHPKDLNPNHRARFILTLSGPSLFGWLQTIYPIMGKRRQAKIREAIRFYKESPRRSYNQKKRRAARYPVEALQ